MDLVDGICLGVLILACVILAAVAFVFQRQQKGSPKLSVSRQLQEVAEDWQRRELEERKKEGDRQNA